MRKLPESALGRNEDPGLKFFMTPGGNNGVSISALQNERLQFFFFTDRRKEASTKKNSTH